MRYLRRLKMGRSDHIAAPQGRVIHLEVNLVGMVLLVLQLRGTGGLGGDEEGDGLMW